MPNFPQLTGPPPNAGDYTTDPWTDGNGQQWTYNVAKNRWHPYTAVTGGVSTFAALTDKESATIATTNTSVADALALLAPKANPVFTGTVTIPSGASISGYLTTATAASTYQPIGSYAPASGIAASAIDGTALVSSDATTAPTASKLVTRDAQSKVGAKGIRLFLENGTETSGIIPDDNLGVQGEVVTLPVCDSGTYIAITNQRDGKANLATGAAGILPKANGGTGVSSLGATGESLMQAATIREARLTISETYYRAVSQNFTNDTIQDVTGFSQTLDANSNYKIEGQIYFTSDAGGILIGWETTALETGAAGYGRGMILGPSGNFISHPYNSIASNMLGIYTESVSRTGRPIMYSIMIRTNSSGGVIKLRARKNTTAGSSVDTVILPSTWASITKIPA